MDVKDTDEQVSKEKNASTCTALYIQQRNQCFSDLSIMDNPGVMFFCIHCMSPAT